MKMPIDASPIVKIPAQMKMLGVHRTRTLHLPTVEAHIHHSSSAQIFQLKWKRFVKWDHTPPLLVTCEEQAPRPHFHP